MMKDLHLTSRSSIFTQTGNFNKVIVKPFVREKQGHTVHKSEVVDKYGKRQTDIQRIDKYNIRIFIKTVSDKLTNKRRAESLQNNTITIFDKGRRH